jgi:hypothetical protein
VVFAFLGVVLIVMFALQLRSAREEARRIRCRGNQNQLAKAIATYLNELGGNTYYPYPLGRGRVAGDYNGAEWLASLYWTGVMPDPGIFICPSSPDTNRDGLDLGSARAAATFGSQTVSYAGMHYYSLTDASGQHVGSAIRDDFPPNRPMASDDTQGTVNHNTWDKRGMSVLFFDSHCEYKTDRDLDLEHAVGQKGGLLRQLRN